MEIAREREGGEREGEERSGDGERERERERRWRESEREKGSHTFSARSSGSSPQSSGSPSDVGAGSPYQRKIMSARKELPIPLPIGMRRVKEQTGSRMKVLPGRRTQGKEEQRTRRRRRNRGPCGRMSITDRGGYLHKHTEMGNLMRTHREAKEGEQDAAKTYSESP